MSALGRYDTAIDCYKKTVKIKPDFYLAWRDKGALFAYLNRHYEALISFNQVIRYKPNDFAVWYLRGNILTTHFQEYKEAIAAYNRAIELKPNFAYAWIGKGEAFYRLGNYEKAREVAQKAVKLKPNDPEFLTFLNILEKHSLPSAPIKPIPNKGKVEIINYPSHKQPNLLW